MNLEYKIMEQKDFNSCAYEGIEKFMGWKLRIKK